TVTLSHETSAAVVVNSTAVVSDPSVNAIGGSVVSAVEGALSSSQTVATLTDPGGAEATSDYAAMIDWGDGNSSAGTISFSAGVFSVSGAHTYTEESAGDHAGSNPYSITVTLSHETSADVVVNSTAIVSDPSVSATGGFVV